MTGSIRKGALAGLALGLATVSSVFASDPASLRLTEGFDGGRLSGEALVPCHRRENALSVQGAAVREGTGAARLEVRPAGAAGEPDTIGQGTIGQGTIERGARPSPSCIDPANPAAAYEDDGTERAELWEPANRRLPFGTEVWYGFSMRVDGTVEPDDRRRLVIGQWKQAGGKSPFVAQRFGNRNFHITFQQDGPGGAECRVLLAYQNEPAPQPDSIDQTTGQPCRSGVTVQRFGPLPSPFGAWTDLVYHVKGSAGTDGVLEVWANGALVARATGRIGYAEGGKQYFKFGPYRDRAPYATAAAIDSFARGDSFDAVASGLNRGAEGAIALGDEEIVGN